MTRYPTSRTTSAVATRLGAAGALLLMIAGQAGAAEVLMGNRAWGFSNQTSRASIAALMLQQEQTGNGTGATGGAYVCGGGGESTSTANYTCIIMNNSTGSIYADQNSTGNQTSSTETSVTANGVPESKLSDVLEQLQ